MRMILEKTKTKQPPKQLINFLLVFISIKLFRASAEPVQQSLRNSLGKLMHSGVIFQDMIVFKSFPKNLG